jgi:hypothetical protein
MLPDSERPGTPAPDLPQEPDVLSSDEWTTEDMADFAQHTWARVFADEAEAAGE